MELRKDVPHPVGAFATVLYLREGAFVIFVLRQHEAVEVERIVHLKKQGLQVWPHEPSSDAALRLVLYHRGVAARQFFVHDRFDPRPVAAGEPRADLWQADPGLAVVLSQPAHVRANGCVVGLVTAAPVVELRVGVDDRELAVRGCDLGEGASAEFGPVPFGRLPVRLKRRRELGGNPLGNAGSHRAETVAAVGDHVKSAFARELE